LIRSNLLHQFIYKRPAYYAVQHLVGFFDDKVKPVGLLTHKSNCPREITVAGFEKEGTSVILLWYSNKIPSDALKWDPVDLTIQGASFRDPVYVEMITGKVYELDRPSRKKDGKAVSFTKLPVWDSPMMIAERSKVDLKQLSSHARP
jgi:hypothetical protein